MARKKNKGKERLLVLMLFCTVLVGLGLWYERKQANPRLNLPDYPHSDRIDLPDDPNIIRIATFNIQVLGTTKLSKPEVSSILGRIIEQFDVVAVQELRSRDNTVIPQLLEIINRKGARYDAVVGPRLGRTTSKEQYVYLFDQNRIELIPPSPYTAKSRDRMHRDPFVAHFRAKGVPAEEAFSFMLINVHTDPDEKISELNALDDLFRTVQDENRTEDDIIILGDFNQDNRDLGELGKLPGIAWAVTGNTKTNTKRTHQYDNILFQKSATSEFQAAWIYNFRQSFNLTEERAQEVSDHLPVWAEFSIKEKQ